MTTDRHVELMQRWLDVYRHGNPEEIEAIVDQHVVNHTAPAEVPAGIAGIQVQIDRYRQAFPDLALTAEEIVADGERVVCRWSARGTHQGPLWGVLATGTAVELGGITILHIRANKIVDHWVYFDQLGLLKQLNVSLR
jgi:steroid delta-isomerase-like uncharacterized protein